MAAPMIDLALRLCGRKAREGFRAALFGLWATLVPSLALAQSDPAQPSSPASAAVTPPKILHFEQAPYPPEAEKLGLEANVILRLDIDKDGKVTAAAVTEAAGHGFGPGRWPRGDR